MRKSCLHELEPRITERRARIDEWLQSQTSAVPIPFYASTDLRNAGYKIATIDTNLFPSGFNNLCDRYFEQTSASARRFIQGRFGAVKRVLIVPESHTRNAYYADNVAALGRIIASAGFEVRVGFLGEARERVVEATGTKGDIVTFHLLDRRGDVLSANGFVPDLIVLNNDLAAGVPEILQGLSQPITPPIEAGWHARRKNVYFELLDGLVREFAAILGVDPWFLSAITEFEPEVDFQASKGVDRLAERVESVLTRTRAKYREHGVDEEPFVFVKHNAGTYGMAVIAVDRPEEVLSPNRRMREKMKTGKGKVEVTEVVVQEGVPSKDLINDCTVEPVMYLMGLDLIGGFFRQHCGKSERENLNQTGATFARLCFRDECERAPSRECYYDTSLRTVYSALAQVAVVAAGHEIGRLAPPSA
jgi:glutamate--cysteine ligase